MSYAKLIPTCNYVRDVCRTSSVRPTCNYVRDVCRTSSVSALQHVHFKFWLVFLVFFLAVRYCVEQDGAYASECHVLFTLFCALLNGRTDLCSALWHSKVQVTDPNSKLHSNHMPESISTGKQTPALLVPIKSHDFKMSKILWGQ